MGVIIPLWEEIFHSIIEKLKGKNSITSEFTLIKNFQGQFYSAKWGILPLPALLQATDYIPSAFLCPVQGNGGQVGLIGTRESVMEKEFLRAEFCSVSIISLSSPRQKLQETNYRRQGTTLCNLPSSSFLSLLGLILSLICVQSPFYSVLILTWYKRFKNYPGAAVTNLNLQNSKIWKTVITFTGYVEVWLFLLDFEKLICQGPSFNLYVLENVSVSQGAHNMIPQTGCLETTEAYSLTAVEARRPRSSWRQGWPLGARRESPSHASPRVWRFWQSLVSWACGNIISVSASVFTRPSPCVQMPLMT